MTGFFESVWNGGRILVLFGVFILVSVLVAPAILGFVTALVGVKLGVEAITTISFIVGLAAVGWLA